MSAEIGRGCGGEDMSTFLKQFVLSIILFGKKGGLNCSLRGPAKSIRPNFFTSSLTFAFLQCACKGYSIFLTKGLSEIINNITIYFPGTNQNCFFPPQNDFFLEIILITDG